CANSHTLNSYERRKVARTNPLTCIFRYFAYFVGEPLMTKILTTQNAQITTATVEVKTLTISGKQVTLSVFRQLREKPLLADDLTLNGTPWGYVNYHPDKCGADDEHLHVVWQDGNDLFRSRFDKPAWRGEYFYSDWADDAVQGRYCANGHRTLDWLRFVHVWQVAHPYDSGRFRLEGILCETAGRPSGHG